MLILCEAGQNYLQKCPSLTKFLPIYIIEHTQTLNLDFSRHCSNSVLVESHFLLPSKSSNVFRGTITIEWNVCRQSLEIMVFRWFLGQATIGNDGVRWLSTIGPRMEWSGTIEQVYCGANQICWSVVNVGGFLWLWSLVRPYWRLLFQQCEG